MINRFFFLFSAWVFLFGTLAYSNASDSFPTHTQYTPIELKPAFLDSNNSYQTASVCFLGSNCKNDGKFNKGDDYQIDTAKQCQNEGYNVTSCTSPKTPYSQCPYNNKYFKECKDITGEKCKNEGYTQSCPEGNVLDDTKICPYNSSYKKCKCAPCEGYPYTKSEAEAEGYILGASCNSCETIKYQRQNAPCNGFLSCECGGEIGSASCKSGTSTLFKQCKECIKCNDECPNGYYKTAGENGRCNFGSYTKTTECGTTCYSCKGPNAGESTFGCKNNCPEGVTYNEETHDYSCNPLTCRNKIKAKYPGYYYGDNFNCSSYINRDYKFDRSFVGEGGSGYYNESICYLSKDIITESFYTEADFGDEISACQNYCRPGTAIKNKTFKGNLYLGITRPSGWDNVYSSNITIDGTLTHPVDGYNYDGLILKSNSKLQFIKHSNDPLSTIRLKNVTLYAGSGISIDSHKFGLYNTTISNNTAATPVTLENVQLLGDITSAHVLAGTSGGIYLNMIPYAYSDMKKYSINRNPGGQIKINTVSITNLYLFKNPGIDTTVTLISSACLTLANNADKKICGGKNGDAIITFLTNDYTKHVLPSCCSKDSGCAASSWNTGTVKCEGYSKQ